MLELTYSAMRARLQAYMKDNFGVLAVMLFIFVAGVASGIRVVQSMYHEQANAILRVLPEVLRAGGVPWLQCMLLSLLSHALCACMLLLSGLWMPAAIFWVVGVLLRGMLLGVAIGACVAAWPAHTAIVLLLLLQLETAVLLPPLLRLCVLSQKQLAGSCRQKLGVTHLHPPLQEYAQLFIRAAAGLLPAIVFQCIFAPAILALFC